jgi:hypothetical protein
VLYCLSHVSSSFCSGYFEDRVLLFAQAGLDLDPHILSFPAISGMTGWHPVSIYGFHKLFCSAGLEM